MTLLFSLLALLLVVVARSDSNSPHTAAASDSQDDQHPIIGEGYIRSCLKDRHVDYHKLPWSDKLARRAQNILDKDTYGLIDDDWVNGLLLLKRVDPNMGEHGRTLPIETLRRSKRKRENENVKTKKRKGRDYNLGASQRLYRCALPKEST
eukprot:sb/3473474/